MVLRRAWLMLGVCCLGCSSLAPFPLGLRLDGDRAAGKQLWDEGQLAMARGDPDGAIACYERSLSADPGMTRNHLSLAAAWLEKGDPVPACPHLAAYVATNPEQSTVRSYYAELLLRLNRPGEARAEFERFDADVQDAPAAAQVIHCHTRLMEIAESVDDEYGMHLHRGIGLYLLARERAALPDSEGQLSAEGLFCQAAAELAQARLVRPDEARSCWYLHEVWSALGQTHPAARWLHEADAAAPFAFLTAAEQRGLQQACRCERAAQER